MEYFNSANLNFNMDTDAKSVWKIAPAPGKNFYPYKIAESGFFYAKNGYYTWRKGKNDYLIVYTVSGHGLLEYMGQNWYLDAGSAVILNCQLQHMYRHAGEEDWVFYWAHIDCRGYCRQEEWLQKANAFPVMVNISGELIAEFEKAISLTESTEESALCRASHCADTILTMLVEAHSSKEQGRDEVDEAVDKAAWYIHNSYAEPLSVEDLARQYNLSQYYFIKRFARRLGTTPYQYLVMVRINEAKKLLRGTNYGIGQIAHIVGFGDESNFSRTFTKQTGSTPARFRKSGV